MRLRNKSATPPDAIGTDWDVRHAAVVISLDTLPGTLAEIQSIQKTRIPRHRQRAAKSDKVETVKTTTTNQTRAERLAGQISNAILVGEFPPGARLDEQQLAGRFGVSRTPVREALRQLATSGLIDLRPRRGALVASVTQEELQTMFAAMAEMEAACARLSAANMTAAEREALQQLQATMAALVKVGDPDAYADANQAFHLAIYAGTHNSVLNDFTANLRSRLAPFRRAQFLTAGRLPRSWEEHQAVVQAILAGDGTAAHAAMLRHVDLVEDAFDEFNSTARPAVPVRVAE
jgi:DNA-binding GntR family transcriptional regulator